MYSFENFQAIKYFGRDIYKGEFTLKEANKDQSSLLVEIINFKNKTKPQELEKKQKKKDALKNLYALFNGRERALAAFENKIFSIKNEGTD